MQTIYGGGCINIDVLKKNNEKIVQLLNELYDVVNLKTNQLELISQIREILKNNEIIYKLLKG